MVIQISPMTRFSESPEPGPVQNSRGVKKAGPFAKLLEGLIRNFKNHAPSPGNGEPPPEADALKTAPIPPDKNQAPPAQVLFPFLFGEEMPPELVPEPVSGIAGENSGEGEKPLLGRRTEKAGKTLPAEEAVRAEDLFSAAGETSGETEKPAAPKPEPREQGAGEAPREKAADFSPPPEAESGAAAFFSLPREEPGETEKKQSGRSPAEPRSAKKSREQPPGLEVRDLRSGQAAQPGEEFRAAGEALQGNRETELVVELHSGGNRNNPPGENPPAQGGPSQAFENLLARELHQNLNGDIVRHASIILRDGGEGTIRLSLKPESLGNVKIHLEMAENKIAGRIIVESNDALRAFEREI